MKISQFFDLWGTVVPPLGPWKNVNTFTPSPSERLCGYTSDEGPYKLSIYWYFFKVNIRYISLYQNYHVSTSKKPVAYANMCSMHIQTRFVDIPYPTFPKQITLPCQMSLLFLEHKSCSFTVCFVYKTLVFHTVHEYMADLADLSFDAFVYCANLKPLTHAPYIKTAVLCTILYNYTIIVNTVHEYMADLFDSCDLLPESFPDAATRLTRFVARVSGKSMVAVSAETRATKRPSTRFRFRSMSPEKWNMPEITDWIRSAQVSSFDHFLDPIDSYLFLFIYLFI